MLLTDLAFEDILQQSKEKILIHREAALRLILASFG